MQLFDTPGIAPPPASITRQQQQQSSSSKKRKRTQDSAASGDRPARPVDKKARTSQGGSRGASAPSSKNGNWSKFQQQATTTRAAKGSTAAAAPLSADERKQAKKRERRLRQKDGQAQETRGGEAVAAPRPASSLAGSQARTSAKEGAKKNKQKAVEVDEESESSNGDSSSSSDDGSSSEDGGASAQPDKNGAAVRALSPGRTAAPLESLGSATKGKGGKGAGETARDKLAGGKFRMLNEALYTTSGHAALELMAGAEDDAFDVYHAGFRAQAKSWPVQPVQVIAKRVLARSPQPTLIVDLGAGDGALTRSIAQLSSSSSKSSSAPRVLAYDLVRDAAGLVARAQCSDYVPLPDGCADCVVICLALMGTDWPAIVMQARRVARKGARLLVAEVASRFVDPSSLAKQDSSSSSSSTVDGFIELVCDLGFSLKHKDTSNTHFSLFDFEATTPTGAQPPMSRQEAVRRGEGLLRPCIYKRR